MNNVYISIQTKSDGTHDIYNAYFYQKTAYNLFMKSYTNEMNFKENGFIFTLKKFNNTGLKGDYSSFCILINDKNERHILSNNKELLNYYVNYRNRIMT